MCKSGLTLGGPFEEPTAGPGVMPCRLPLSANFTALKIPVINKSPHALPAYQTHGAAGMDLIAWLPEPVELASLERRLIPTGLYLALPEGYEAQIRPRSGMAFKKGISIVNSPGTIDPDYRGELMIAVVNLNPGPVRIEDGERIAQMVISRFETAAWEPVESLDDTVRGAGGFGHTGHQQTQQPH
jgi:dUTP pyrophosphatase